MTNINHKKENIWKKYFRQWLTKLNYKNTKFFIWYFARRSFKRRYRTQAPIKILVKFILFCLLRDFFYYLFKKVIWISACELRDVWRIFGPALKVNLACELFFQMPRKYFLKLCHSRREFPVLFFSGFYITKSNY